MIGESDQTCSLGDSPPGDLGCCERGVDKRRSQTGMLSVGRPFSWHQASEWHWCRVSALKSEMSSRVVQVQLQRAEGSRGLDRQSLETVSGLAAQPPRLPCH